MNDLIKKTARELSVALESRHFSEDKKDALEEILIEFQNASQISICDPELITITYPMMLEAVTPGYAQGMQTAVNAILGTEERGNNEYAREIGSPLADYPEQKTVLDLSDQPENLDLFSLAQLIYDILQHPATPSGLYSAIAGELTDMTNSIDWHSLAMIQKTVESYGDGKKQGSNSGGGDK